MIKTQMFDYHDDDVLLEGYYAYDDKITGKRPAVLVVHDWSGKNKFACHKAEKLAELGYLGFAVDMYGKGKIAHTKEEKMALMKPLIEDRTHLQKRILAAFTAVKTLEFTDKARIAAIGFCFGGLCALDLARSGADVKAVVSFHGLLHPPEGMQQHAIIAQILALHGFNDPMVTIDQVNAFAEEMTHAKVDWQINVYSHAMHAFTNPDANDPAFGTVYNKKADARSFIAMKIFLEEVLR